MVFLDSIYQLQYYNQQPGQPCYCEAIVNSKDLMLQAPVNVSSYATSIYLYSADGLTLIADITDYFELYFFSYNGQTYFNARLNSFPPQMCANPCFILYIEIDKQFKKFTERYCVAACCELPGNIVSQSQTVGGQPIQQLVPVDDANTAFIDLSGLNVPRSECGEPLLTLTQYADCYDAANNIFYGIPTNVLSGSPTFGYQIVTNMRGRIIRQPREITIDRSYNCKILRAESFRPWLLEGFEWFPAWKMDELEAGFHANHIIVNDYRTYKEYQFAGGTSFFQPYSCWESFGLRMTLQDCTARVNYGCGDDCNTGVGASKNIMSFTIGNPFVDLYMDEGGKLVGSTYDQLLAYFNQYGIVTDKTSESGSPCYFEHAFTVEANGYIPSSFYINRKLGANRIFGVRGEIPSCQDIPNCDYPTFGTVTIKDTTCVAPTFGTPIIADVAADELTITDANGWVQKDFTTATLYNGAVNINIESENTAYTGSGEYLIGGQVIGNIEPAGRPTANRSIVIDSNNTVLVETSGNIRLYGYGTATGTETTISFNINYNL